MGWFRSTFDPKIGKHLLRDEGEVVVDEVPHHWIVYIVPALQAAGGVALLYLFLLSPVDVAWVPLTLGLLVLAYAAWRALNEHMDRFVVTNMRVFRVRGVLSQRLATMPLGRILGL